MYLPSIELLVQLKHLKPGLGRGLLTSQAGWDQPALHRLEAWYLYDHILEHRI